MKITWYGHSCFKVETDQGSVVFDPYEDGRVPGYALLPRNLSADAVLCSHEHRDHSAVERVKLSGSIPTFSVQEISTYHDEAKGEKRGENTIRVISAEGMRLAHMGDLGCELTEEQLAVLRGVDVLLIPVGGFYTIDASQAKTMADAIGARVVIPMHYRNGQLGYEVIGTLESFTKQCNNVVNYATNSIVVTADTPQQTAVLTYLAD
ncbi:MBL fold metallo-hydrolase [Oscillospiraceae bacterium LTW-04]|nr:MBL fold metallo-hydrolase [Oscillospiraceae bacterium MB24-C1]